MYQKNTPEYTEGNSSRSASQFQRQVRISVHKLRGVMEKGREREIRWTAVNKSDWRLIFVNIFPFV